MLSLLILLNYAFVFLYGLILTTTFSNVFKIKKYSVVFAIFFIVDFMFQIILFYKVGQDMLYKLYPLITHIPLILILIFYCKKTWITALASMVCAYLFTLPRHWIGALASISFNESVFVFYITEILITFPLLYFIYRYIAPAIAAIFEEDSKKKWYIVTVLIFYYFFITLLAVYSNLIFSGNRLIIGFVASTFIISFFIFSSLYYRESQNRTHAENDRNLLEIMINQAHIMIDQMKQSQEQVIVYRHDLRHHLAHINTHLERNDISSAKDYIVSISKGIDTTSFATYCENQTVNILLSYYVNVAEKLGISCEVHTHIPEFISIPPVDLCVIIANAMENATRACSMVTHLSKPIIVIKASTQNDKLFLEISNPYEGDVIIDGEMPVTSGDRIGIGTKSIVMAVEKYQGLWEFKTLDQVFYMHVVL